MKKSETWRSAAIVLASLGLAASSACGGGGEPGQELMSAGPTTAGFSVADLPEEYVAQRVGVAAGYGWLITSEDPKTLWRLGRDGSTSASSTLSDLSVSSMAAFDGGLALSGRRCRGPGSGGECRSTSGVVRLVMPDGSVAWEVELWSTKGHAGDTESVLLLGSTDAKLWAVSSDGTLVAIDAGGRIANRVPRASGDPCLLGNDLYSLAQEQPPGVDGSSGAPPTASVPVDGDGRVIPGAETYVVHRVVEEGWERAPASGYTVKGTTILGRCANGGFEISIDQQVVVRWTARTQGWTELSTNADGVEAAPGSRAMSNQDIGFLIDSTSGEVLRRDINARDAVIYRPTGVMFEFAIDAAQPGVGLRVAEQGDTVFACGTPTAPGGTSTCEFGTVEG